VEPATTDRIQRMIDAEAAERSPRRYLEFWFGENGRQGRSMHRLGGPPDDPARSEQDLG
jgi:hypothetical protein